MKNLKKVLALALAFVMCFTMFAGAAVYADVPAGSDYSEAVTMLSDLGVIAGYPDGNFYPEKTVTRAEAAAFIARLMTGETNPTKYAGASNFVDVPANHFAESSIAYCVVNGIVFGIGDGKFAPDRAVTDGEFVAMMTRAMGYDTVANPLQFPYGNISAAQNEGLLDGVTIVPNSPALRGEDAQMIYNALFADYDRLAKAENIFEGADEHDEYTIAESVFGLGKLKITNKDTDFNAEGKCQAHTWVVAGVDARNTADEYVAYAINDKTNKVDEKEVITFTYEGDAEAILGYQVELWGEMDHTGEVKEVVAVKTVKDQIGYEWNASKGGKIDKLAVTEDVNVDAEDATLALPNLAADGIFTKNGKKDVAFDLDGFKKDSWDNKDGDSYRLVDWDSDDNIDFAVKTTRKYAEVEELDKDEIVLKALDEETKVYDLDDKHLVFDVDGVEEGDVVEITVDRSYSKKGEVVTLTLTPVESEEKELTKVSTKGTLAMYFDGERYYVAENKGADKWNLVNDNADARHEDNLEEDYNVWVDANGYVIKATLIEDANTGYLVPLSLEDGVKKATADRSTKAGMKAILDDNTVDFFEVDFDLELKLNEGEGATYGSYDDDDYAWEYGHSLIGRVFKYWMNEDGEITKLVAATDKQANGDAYYHKTGVVTGLEDENEKLVDENICIKGANVLFVTDDEFISEYDDGVKTADADKIMAIEATSENVKKLRKSDKETLDVDDTGYYFAVADFAYKASDVSNKASVAILAISNFDDLDTNKGVALITDVDAEGKKNTVFTIEGAFDGEIVDDLKTVTVKNHEVGKIFFDEDDNPFKDMDALEKTISNAGGVYAEIRTNEDGLVNKVTLLTKGSDDYNKNGYTIARRVVGEEANDEFVSYVTTVDGVPTVKYAKKDAFYSIDILNSYMSLDLADGADIYSITNKAIAETDDDKELKAANDFTDEPKIEVIEAKNIKTSKNLRKDKVFNDKYAVADFIIKDGKVVAVFSFAERFDEVDDKAVEAPARLVVGRNKADNSIAVIVNDLDDEGIWFRKESVKAGSTIDVTNWNDDMDIEYVSGSTYCYTCTEDDPVYVILAKNDGTVVECVKTEKIAD